LTEPAVSVSSAAAQGCGSHHPCSSVGLRCFGGAGNGGAGGLGLLWS